MPINKNSPNQTDTQTVKTISEIVTTVTQTSIIILAAISSGSQSLISANSNRKKLIIHNNTNRIIFVLIGGGTANTTVQYLLTQLGTTGLAGWAPAIIAVSVGMLLLGMFMVGKGGNGRQY